MLTQSSRGTEHVTWMRGKESLLEFWSRTVLEHRNWDGDNRWSLVTWSTSGRLMWNLSVLLLFQEQIACMAIFFTAIMNTKCLVQFNLV